LNVIGDGEPIDVEVDTQDNIESSSDIIPGCPAGDWHDYDKLLNTFGHEHNEMASIYHWHVHDGPGREYINYRRILIARHILRHHQLRDTPLGLNAYSVLYYWSTQTSGSWHAVSCEAKKVLAQDPNLAINIERLKDSESDVDPWIRESAYKHGARVLQELRALKRANINSTPEWSDIWTYKKSTKFNDQVPANYDGWSTGTLGFNNRNKIIESIRQAGPITFTIEPRKIEFPRHCPDRLGPLLKEGPGFQKFAYDGRWHANCFYVIADPYKVAINKFDPQNMRNGEVAFSLSGALQDRLDSGEKSFVDVLDKPVASWCAEAIGHQKAEARFITPASIDALKHWK